MLSLFAVPKRFNGEFSIIQSNAIKSWLRLRPKVQILLFLEKDVALPDDLKDASLTVVSDFAVNEFGTPMLDDIFARAASLAAYPILCYANSDIVFLDDALPAVTQVEARLKQFLMLGQRHDVDIRHRIRFEKGWEEEMRRYAARTGHRHPPGGLDYFVFRSKALIEIPPFAIGRAAWDNWFVSHALKRKIPVVDVTERVLAIHQNHSYSHLPEGVRRVRKGPEADENKRHAGQYAWRFSVHSATHVLTANGRLIPALDRNHLRARLLALRTHHAPLDRAANRIGKIKPLLSWLPQKTKR